MKWALPLVLWVVDWVRREDSSASGNLRSGLVGEVEEGEGEGEEGWVGCVVVEGLARGGNGGGDLAPV